MRRVAGLYTRYPGEFWEYPTITPRKAFRPSFRLRLSGTLAKTAHTNTLKVDALGIVPVRSVKGIPPDGPTALLKVRLRRCTTVRMAHDHMLLGTDMACNMEEAQSRSVRHGRSAFPSIWCA
jgi:hypothetical protein